MTKSEDSTDLGETGAFEVLLIPDLSPMEGIIHVCFEETTFTRECRGVTIDTTCIRHAHTTDAYPPHVIGLQCKNAFTELFKVIMER